MRFAVIVERRAYAFGNVPGDHIGVRHAVSKANREPAIIGHDRLEYDLLLDRVVAGVKCENVPRLLQAGQLLDVRAAERNAPLDVIGRHVDIAMSLAKSRRELAVIHMLPPLASCRMNRPHHVGHFVQSDQVVLLRVASVQLALCDESDAGSIICRLISGVQVLYRIWIWSGFLSRPVVNSFEGIFALTVPRHHINFAHAYAEAKRHVSVVRHLYFELQLFSWDQIGDLDGGIVVAFDKAVDKRITRVLRQLLCENVVTA